MRRSRSRSRSRESSVSSTSSIQHFPYRKDELIAGRYRVLSKLGDGTFGRVLCCRDQKFHDKVALKVIRNIPKYVENARIEAEILDKIFEKSKSAHKYIVKLYHTFKLNDHYCLSFELLDISLLDWLKERKYKPFSASDIHEIIKQSLDGLSFLHFIECLHTDIKMENIMVNFDSRSSLRVKFIDFGNAIFPDDYKPKTVNTTQYRSIEVLLEIPYSYPSDVWSLACVFAECYTGNLLFDTHSDNDNHHIALIQKIVNKPIPPHLIRISPRHRELFDNEMTVKYPMVDEGVVDEDELRKFQKTKRLDEIFHNDRILLLVENMLDLDQRQRWTAQQAYNYYSNSR
jgi:serine/threonine protein kinase